jgi:diguanylate cyclase (GGDEF)-like protein/PAS domain S-box-containing protein
VPQARFVFDARGGLLSSNSRAQAMGWPTGHEGLAEVVAQSRAWLDRHPRQRIQFLHRSPQGDLEAKMSVQGAGGERRYSLSLVPTDEFAGALEARQHERWRYALDNAEDGLWDWDAESDRVYRSPRCLGMLGYQPGEIADTLEAWRGLVHPDDLERQDAALSAHLRGGSEHYKVEYRLRHASGAWRWVLDRGKVIYWSPEGRPQRVAGTHTDISNYKELELRLREREVLLDEAQRIGHIGSWALDTNHQSVWWSPELFRIFGWPLNRQAPNWEQQRALYPAEAYARLDAALAIALSQGKGFAMEVELIRPDGERRHIEVASDVVRNEAGGVQRVVGVVRDVTEQQRATATARWRNKLLDRIAAMGRIGAFDLDFGSGSFQWTDENYRIHDIEPGTPVSIEMLMSHYDADSQERLRGALARMMGGHSQEETVEVEFVTGEGRRIVLRITGHVEAVDGTPFRITGLTQDITEEREAGERIEQLAHFDPLTGLPNRYLFRRRATDAIRVAQRADLSLALMFVDLDHFKNVNDTLGHAAGDQLLQEVAGRLKSCLRGSDLIGRQGGDEFMVMLCEVRKPEDAALVAGKIIAAVGAPYMIGEVEIQIGCSIGIALLGEDSGDLDALMRASDTAMYAAKEQGRNTFQFYNDSFFERVHRRALLERELRQALARDELSLVYQPTVSLAPGAAVVGIEALLRWHRPGDEPRSPLEFIPIAEESGEIIPIGLWVLETACRQARAWQVAGLPFSTIAVNVSAVQLRDAGFADRVVAICARAGWPPQWLVLELTESALMRDTEVLRRTFATFERHGIQLSVDDFGTGFSNLMYLHRFPVRQLKIDRSFVSQMLEELQVGVLTQAIISLGHAMGLTVIAEGVENEISLRALRNQGCDEVQGYHLTRPLPADAMAEWIRARAAAAPASAPDTAP